MFCDMHLLAICQCALDRCQAVLLLPCLFKCKKTPLFTQSYNLKYCIIHVCSWCSLCKNTKLQIIFNNAINNVCLKTFYSGDQLHCGLRKKFYVRKGKIWLRNIFSKKLKRLQGKKCKMYSMCLYAGNTSIHFRQPISVHFRTQLNAVQSSKYQGNNHTEHIY